jgi:hypothetical protein
MLRQFQRNGLCGSAPLHVDLLVICLVVRLCV